MNTTKKIIKQEFNIEGLSCVGCANTAQQQLKNVRGVLSAMVSFDNKNAIIEYDQVQTTSQELKNALDQVGYKLIVE